MTESRECPLGLAAHMSATNVITSTKKGLGPFSLSCGFTKSLVSKGRWCLLHMESLCHCHFVMGTTAFTARLCFSQPPGIPVFCHLWRWTVLQWPRLPALPPFLCCLCWYLLLLLPLFSYLCFGLHLAPAIFLVALGMFQGSVEGHISPDNCAPILTEIQSSAPCPHGET